MPPGLLALAGAIFRERNLLLFRDTLLRLKSGFTAAINKAAVLNSDLVEIAQEAVPLLMKICNPVPRQLSAEMMAENSR